MRRIISILLLLTMLVTGAHPVFAMHFCEGKLFSVNLVNNQREHSCCEKMVKMSEEDCNNKMQSQNDASSTFFKMKNSCCDFKQVKLSTDDFNNQLQQFNFNNIHLSFENVWLVLYSALNYLEPQFSVTVQHIFPPGGLNKSNLDLLTYICTYRI